jgi:hypothetical protein
VLEFGCFGEEIVMLLLIIYEPPDLALYITVTVLTTDLFLFDGNKKACVDNMGWEVWVECVGW